MHEEEAGLQEAEWKSGGGMLCLPVGRVGMEHHDNRLDRSCFSVATLGDDDSRQYWRGRTPEERLAALEFLRQVMYGYDPASARVQRLLEVDELARR